MYLLSILTVIIGLFLILINSFVGISGLTNYLDLTGLILLLIITVPIILSTGHLKDLNNALKLGMKKHKETNIAEIKRAMEAVELTMKALFYSGAFICVASLIIVLHLMDDPATLGPSCSVALIVLTYALAMNMVLLPLKSKLKFMLIEFMQE